MCFPYLILQRRPQPLAGRYRFVALPVLALVTPPEPLLRCGKCTGTGFPSESISVSPVAPNAAPKRSIGPNPPKTFRWPTIAFPLRGILRSL
jgi:hypothetical protein